MLSQGRPGKTLGLFEQRQQEVGGLDAIVTGAARVMKCELADQPRGG